MTQLFSGIHVKVDRDRAVGGAIFARISNQQYQQYKQYRLSYSNSPFITMASLPIGVLFVEPDSDDSESGWFLPREAYN